MRQWTFGAQTAAAALLVCSAAQAQVTAEQVWENWQALMVSAGQTVTTTSVSRNGDTLVVDGLKMMVDEAGSKMEGTIDQVLFRDKGDGTVEVTMSETYPITLTVPPTEGQSGPTELSVTVTQPGMVVTAGGNEAETRYDFVAPTINIDVQGRDADSPPFAVVAALTNVSGDYLVAKSGETSAVDSNFLADRMVLSLSGKDDETQSDVKFNADVQTLSGTSKGTFLGAAAMADFAAALRGGFAVDGAFTYGAATFDADVTEAGANTKITGTAESGAFNVGMNASRLGYGVSSKGVAVNFMGADLPFPVNVTYSESAFDLAIPVAKSDTPSDFTFLTKIVDLAISEEIWSMVDPAGNLPHDPATLVVDTKGTAKLTVDLMDEAAMASLGDGPPGELYSLDIAELRAKVAGAELTGAGAFTFDNTDLTTFGGMPAPTGKIDMKLVGGNGLLDKLVAMGLIPEDQAMGARMMVSMFANPGSGPDELTSTLEFKDKGFYANGQRLQ